jgi:hypothetical protein
MAVGPQAGIPGSPAVVLGYEFRRRLDSPEARWPEHFNPVVDEGSRPTTRMPQAASDGGCYDPAAARARLQERSSWLSHSDATVDL